MILSIKNQIQMRRAKRVIAGRALTKPPADGGWNMFSTGFSGLDFSTPASHLPLRGNGKGAWFGWPDNPKALPDNLSRHCRGKGRAGPGLLGVSDGIDDVAAAAFQQVTAETIATPRIEVIGLQIGGAGVADHSARRGHQVTGIALTFSGGGGESFHDIAEAYRI